MKQGQTPAPFAFACNVAGDVEAVSLSDSGNGVAGTVTYVADREHRGGVTVAVNGFTAAVEPDGDNVERVALQHGLYRFTARLHSPAVAMARARAFGELNPEGRALTTSEAAALVGLDLATFGGVLSGFTTKGKTLEGVASELLPTARFYWDGGGNLRVMPNGPALDVYCGNVAEYSETRADGHVPSALTLTAASEKRRVVKPPSGVVSFDRGRPFTLNNVNEGSDGRRTTTRIEYNGAGEVISQEVSVTGSVVVTGPDEQGVLWQRKLENVPLADERSTFTYLDGYARATKEEVHTRKEYAYAYETGRSPALAEDVWRRVVYDWRLSLLPTENQKMLHTLRSKHAYEKRLSSLKQKEPELGKGEHMAAGGYLHRQTSEHYLSADGEFWIRSYNQSGQRNTTVNDWDTGEAMYILPLAGGIDSGLEQGVTPPRCEPIEANSTGKAEVIDVERPSVPLKATTRGRAAPVGYSYPAASSRAVMGSVMAFILQNSGPRVTRRYTLLAPQAVEVGRHGVTSWSFDWQAGGAPVLQVETAEQGAADGAVGVVDLPLQGMVLSISYDEGMKADVASVKVFGYVGEPATERLFYFTEGRVPPAVGDIVEIVQTPRGLEVKSGKRQIEQADLESLDGLL